MDFQHLLNKLFREPTSSIFIQLFRYLFVGGTAFVVDFGLLFVFTDVCGLHYLLSATASFVAGLLTNYALSIAWVFNRRKLANRWSELLVFTLIGVIGLGLNSLFMWLLTEPLGLHYLLSKIVTAIIVMFWNFLARKFALF